MVLMMGGDACATVAIAKIVGFQTANFVPIETIGFRHSARHSLYRIGGGFGAAIFKSDELRHDFKDRVHEKLAPILLPCEQARTNARGRSPYWLLPPLGRTGISELDCRGQ
jgi:hypothetical protein